MARTQKILITGASSGFGLETAIGLAERGHDVTAAAETWPQVRSFRETAERRKVTLEVIKLDLLDPIDLAHAALVETDILVLNAGIQESGAMVDLPIERLRRSFDINLFGHLDLVQRMMPALLKRRHPKIFWMSSIAGITAVPFLGAYSATKHAIEAVAGAMHLELAPLGVTVATFAPGVFRTGFNDTGVESMRQWHDAGTAIVPVPPLGAALKVQSDPREMIDAMIETIPARKHRYRTMRPESAEKLAKTAQQADWVMPA
jgi:NAD(P)-dependent dehydrogenase (short-subunit alcohol dehydrogenase family)